MKNGDKIVCVKIIYNIFGDPLFNCGEIYRIKYIEKFTNIHYVYNNLGGYRYSSMSAYSAKNNFVMLKEYRKLKLKKLNVQM